MRSQTVKASARQTHTAWGPLCIALAALLFSRPVVPQRILVQTLPSSATQSAMAASMASMRNLHLRSGVASQPKGPARLAIRRASDVRARVSTVEAPVAAEAPAKAQKVKHHEMNEPKDGFKSAIMMQGEHHHVTQAHSPPPTQHTSPDRRPDLAAHAPLLPQALDG